MKVLVRVIICKLYIAFSFHKLSRLPLLQKPCYNLNTKWDHSPSPAFSLRPCNSTFVHAYFTAVTGESWRNCSEICNAPRVFVSPEREPPPINYAPFSLRKRCRRHHFSSEDENRREQLNSWAKRYARRIMVMAGIGEYKLPFVVRSLDKFLRNSWNGYFIIAMLKCA